MCFQSQNLERSLEISILRKSPRSRSQIPNTKIVFFRATSAHKPAELLARYCDILLRRSAGNELEAGLKDAMAVFRLLEDKDVFQTCYARFLASRLIQQNSNSDEAESVMIGKLKHSCGFEYTAKLQRMFQVLHVLSHAQR